MKRLNDISRLTSALYFAQQRHDVELIKAYLLDFRPPQEVEFEYLNIMKGLNQYNYSEKVEKVVDLLANM